MDCAWSLPDHFQGISSVPPTDLLHGWFLKKEGWVGGVAYWPNGKSAMYFCRGCAHYATNHDFHDSQTLLKPWLLLRDSRCRTNVGKKQDTTMTLTTTTTTTTSTATNQQANTVPTNWHGNQYSYYTYVHLYIWFYANCLILFFESSKSQHLYGHYISLPSHWPPRDQMMPSWNVPALAFTWGGTRLGESGGGRFSAGGRLKSSGSSLRYG